ncbi:hypothetical protein D3C71_1309270 [compost metagenome]
MAKSNADIQRNKRAKEKALLDRIGAKKRSLIVSKALADALQVLGERHDFEEWQEALSTFILNLAAAPTEEPSSGSHRGVRPIRQHVATRNHDQRKRVAKIGTGIQA